MIKIKAFWFGCQSNTAVGLGHVSRCIALAEEFGSRGYISCFAHLSEIDSRGVELMSLSGLTINCTCSAQPIAVLYDSYDLNFIRKFAWPRDVRFILLVDELSPTLDADGYIQASPIESWSPSNKSSKVLNFDSNPILRKAYDTPVTGFRSKPPFDVLISLGAAKDFVGILSHLIPEIQSRKRIFRSTTVLLGGNSISAIMPRDILREVNSITGTLNFRSILTADSFIISAAGVTAWELISLKVPGFLIGAADNQMEQLAFFNENGLRRGIPFQGNQDFSSELRNLIDSTQVFESTRSKPNLLRNGRVEAVDWILREILSQPDRPG